MKKQDKHIQKVLDLFDDKFYTMNKIHPPFREIKSFITTAILDERKRICKELKGKAKTYLEIEYVSKEGYTIIERNVDLVKFDTAQEVVKGKE